MTTELRMATIEPVSARDIPETLLFLIKGSSLSLDLIFVIGFARKNRMLPSITQHKLKPELGHEKYSPKQVYSLSGDN
jgi:hypothetical protein